MKSKIFYNIINKHMKERDISEYKIEKITLSERNFSVNKDGELESVGYIDVIIKPKCKLDEITISVKQE